MGNLVETAAFERGSLAIDYGFLAIKHGKAVEALVRQLAKVGKAR